MTETTEPRIYVACLASYNAGELHGVWIDATQDADDIQAEVDVMLKASPEPHAEEWAIHDHEGFGGLPIGENDSFEGVSRLATLLEEHGAVFAGVVDHFGIDYLDTAIDCMTDNYQGKWDSLEDWAENWHEDCGTLASMPEDLRCFFDMEQWAKDCKLGGDIFTVEIGRKVHVFDSSRN